VEALPPYWVTQGARAKNDHREKEAEAAKLGQAEANDPEASKAATRSFVRYERYLTALECSMRILLALVIPGTQVILNISLISYSVGGAIKSCRSSLS
jgi:hypothetical protein